MRNKFLFGMLVTVLAFSVLVGCTEPAEDHGLVGTKWDFSGTALTDPSPHGVGVSVISIEFKADGTYDYIITDTGVGIMGFRGKYTINTSENKKEITYTITHLQLAADPVAVTIPNSLNGPRNAAWKEIPGDFYWSGDDKNAPDKIRDFLKDIAKDGITTGDADKATFEAAYGLAADKAVFLGLPAGGFGAITDLFNNVYLKYAKYKFVHTITEGTAKDELTLTTDLATGEFERNK